LDFLPWEGESASNEICPCCGIQFGYHDATPGSLIRRVEIYDEWRRNWINMGMPWQGIDIEPPTNWDPIRQLSQTTNDH
jgi:hypothetical protein